MIEDKNPHRTSVSQIGAFNLIKHLTQKFDVKQSSTKKSIGDDAAILHFKDINTVIATTMLIETVHFDLSYVPLRHLGYKSVVQAVSNICAMNACPTQITVAVAFSNRFTLEALEEFFDGIYLASKTYNIDVIGGETTTAPKGLVISITAIGESKEQDILSRNGARENDLIVATGDFGAAYMGLQVLEREKQVFLVNQNNQPDLDRYSYIIERQLKPEARTDIKLLLEKLNIKPTAMIDVTDGVASDVLHICNSSDKGCIIYEEKLPMDPQFISVCEEFKLDSTTVVLNGGEDYELLFTITLEDFEKIKGNPNFTVIGHIAPKTDGCALITRANQKLELKARGWGNNA